MVAVNHIPHLVHTQTAFVWRFLALSAGESQIIHVTAWTEREARNRCPSGCVAVFAARIRLNTSGGQPPTSDKRFFCVRKPTHTRIMAGRNGGAFVLAGFQMTSLLTLLRLATMFSSVVERLLKIHLGAFHMAVSARPYFVWRFMQCLTDSIAIFTVTAATEREARAQLPHAHLIFVARIRQGGGL